MSPLEKQSCRNDRTPLCLLFPLLSVSKLQPWVGMKSQSLEWMALYSFGGCERRRKLTPSYQGKDGQRKQFGINNNNTLKIHQSDCTGHVAQTKHGMSGQLHTLYPRGAWIWLERLKESHRLKLRVPCYSQSGVSDQDRNRFVDPTPDIIVRDIFTALSILLLDPNFFEISEFACNCGTKHVQTY